MTDPKKVRIDKWLWAVRIYKTRALAKKACEAGRVRIGEEVQKPSKLLTGGEILDVRINRQNRKFRVEKPIEKRVGASIAVNCYEEITPREEKEKRLLSAFYHVEKRDAGKGRPTKKERRDIDKHKGKDQF